MTVLRVLLRSNAHTLFLAVICVTAFLAGTHYAVGQVDTALAMPADTTPPSPATSLIAADHQYDNGETIDLTWVPSIDDQLLHGSITGYQIYRSDNGGPFAKVGDALSGDSQFSDGNVAVGNSYVYYVVALTAHWRAESVHTAPIVARREWINYDRKYLFFIGLIIAGSVVYFIETARREFDTEKRHRLFQRFHEIIHEEQPYTFLFTTEALVAVNRRFENVQVYPLGLAPRQWWVPAAMQRYRQDAERLENRKCF